MQIFLNNLANIFSLKYWFDLSPEPFFAGVEKALYLVFILFIIASFAAKIVIKQNKKNTPLKNTWFKFQYFFGTIGFFGIVFTFFRVQSVYFLGAPFWLGVLGVVSIVWLVFIVRYVKVKVPKIKEEIATRKEMEKYLPKK